MGYEYKTNNNKEVKMAILNFTVDQNNRLLKVEKSKDKGLFESKKDKKYADKIKNKLIKKQKGK